MFHETENIWKFLYSFDYRNWAKFMIMNRTFLFLFGNDLHLWLCTAMTFTLTLYIYFCDHLLHLLYGTSSILSWSSNISDGKGCSLDGCKPLPTRTMPPPAIKSQHYAGTNSKHISVFLLQITFMQHQITLAKVITIKESFYFKTAWNWLNLHYLKRKKKPKANQILAS